MAAPGSGVSPPFVEGQIIVKTCPELTRDDGIIPLRHFTWQSGQWVRTFADEVYAVPVVDVDAGEIVGWMSEGETIDDLHNGIA